MLDHERRRLICNYIVAQGSSTVEELVVLTGCSASTVRRDLKRLAADNKIEKTHGGAVRRTEEEPHYYIRVDMYPAEKKRIGALAASLVQPGETVMIDAGTTTMEVARQLINKNPLTVVTDAINIAMVLEKAAGITVIMTGGILRGHTHSLVGSIAEENLRFLHPDKVIIGTGGIAADGLTHSNLEAIPLKQVMIQAGRQVIVVADRSKVGRRALAPLVPLDAVHVLVTDKDAPPDVLAGIASRGVQVLLA